MNASKIALACALMCAGCGPHSKLEQPLAQASRLAEGSAFIASIVSKSEGDTTYAIALLAATTGKEYVIPLGESAPGRRTALLELPPGRYRATAWVTTGSLVVEHRHDLAANDVLARPFDLEAGRVLLLGRFEYRTEYSTVWKKKGGKWMNRTSWRVVPRPLTISEGTAIFREDYPAFAQAPVACLSCEADPAPSPSAAPDRSAASLADLERECDHGDAGACAELGVRYAKGNGLAADPVRGVHFHARACGLGEQGACRLLGSAHERGVGAPKDPARAAALYRGACDAGVGAACSDLGRLVSSGRGGTQDAVAGAALYRQT